LGGVAVDSSGNFYVANASTSSLSPSDVIEYSSGGGSVVNTFLQKLHHPVNVAISNGYLWVVDQDMPPTLGCSGNSAVFAYPINAGQNPPSAGAACDPDGNGYPIMGVALSGDNVLISTSSVGDVFPPPQGSCPGVADEYVLVNPLHNLLIAPFTLSNNAQAWGLSFDTSGNFYASDYCNNAIEKYAYAPIANFTNIGQVPGTFNAPTFETISSDDLLAVPNPGNGANGYVTEISIGGVTPPITITNSLQGPIGAAAGP
jgi:hypothetical protein